MKIALVSKLYPPPVGGIERHVQLLARTLRDVDASLEIEVIVGQELPREYRKEIENGIVIHRAATIVSIFSTPVTLGFSKLLKRTRADIYHFHFPYPWGELAALRARLEAPIIVTYHSDIVRQRIQFSFYRPFLLKFLDQANRIIVWSTELAVSSPVLRRYQDKLVVVPGGIDTRRFTPTEETRKKATLLRKSLAGDQPIILFVGRFVYYKGLEYLVQAMKHLPGVLLLVGNGPLEGQLKTLVSKLKLCDRVKFIGNVNDNELPIYYQASDVFVLPSIANSEAYGLVQLEAHASGIPVVSTALPTGVTFVNQHGYTGLVVPPKDVAALAEALRCLLKNDALRMKLGRQAQQRAFEEFDIRVCAQAALQVYREVLSNAGGVKT